MTTEDASSQCIGRRNYVPFIAFLVSAVLNAVYAMSFSAWHIHRRSELGSDWARRWDVIGSFVVAVLAFAFFVPIAGLLGYHVRLLCSNRTTIEMVNH